jgi:hypothetical protein
VRAQINIDGPIKIRQARGFHQGMGRNARIVDHNIQVSENSHRPGHNRLGSLFTRYCMFEADNGGIVGMIVTKALIRQINRQNPRPFSGKKLGCRPANAGCGPSDNGGTPA